MQKAETQQKFYLRQAAHIFGTVSSMTKEEAFYKGYLMGLGGNLPYVDLKLIELDSETFIPIERSVQEIHEQVRKQTIEDAKELLREIYVKEGREIPGWL